MSQLAGLGLLFLAACAPAAINATPIARATASAIPHGAEIRFGLIGAVTEANVWALFDSQGYSYNNYAVRSSYWPRLYDLSIPGGEFEAVAASSNPSAIEQEGALFTGTVPVRSDLHWTDGRPLTAEDVAFTANTALAFRLDFDWGAYYDPAWLDHAEAVQPDAVKFYFGTMPNVGVWQYGALQGPVVQSAYWSAKVASAATLLPAADLEPQIEELKRKVTELQFKVDTVRAASFAAISGDQARQLQADLRRQQGNLDEANNDLSKAQVSVERALEEARTALFALDSSGEPHLGGWLPAAGPVGSGAGLALVNEANSNFPGAVANFDRASYRTYITHEAALAGLENGTVDVILDPSQSPRAGKDAMASASRNVRFLVFQPGSSILQAPLRQALSCMIDQQALVRELNGPAEPLASFVLPEESIWYEPDTPLACHMLDASGRLANAVEMLKAGGYTWQQEPGPQTAGRGLATPDGTLLPAVQLWAPQDDEMRASAAAYVERQARQLGLEVRAQRVSREAVDYAALSSRRYDMLILGWRVSAYPGYLCDWFGAGMPFDYEGSVVKAGCGELRSTSDLSTARAHMRGIQSGLASDVPMVPLWSDLVYDTYRHVVYPFDRVPGGLGAVFGAPGLAIPSVP
jgi:ABC-type transport system substrate-binding protein